MSKHPPCSVVGSKSFFHCIFESVWSIPRILRIELSDHPSWSLIVVFNLSLVLFQTREVETFLEKNFFCFNLFYIEMAAVVVGQSWRNLIQRRTSLEISLTGELPTEFLMVVVVISIKRVMIMRAWSSFKTLWWKNPPTSLKTKRFFIHLRCLLETMTL